MAGHSTDVVVAMTTRAPPRGRGFFRLAKRTLTYIQPALGHDHSKMPAQHHLSRCFWQELDRTAGAAALVWLSILDRICGPEPPTPADEKRDTHFELGARYWDGSPPAAARELWDYGPSGR